MKKLKKVIFILIVIISILGLATSVNALEAGEAVDMIDNLQNTSKNSVDASSILDTVNMLLGFLQVASAIIGVIVIAFTGFNYIIAETPQMKDELKKKMLPWIVGLILVFGASSIMTFILGVVGG